MFQRRLTPLADRGPLRTLFALTSMPVGGAETLLVNLIRRLDRDRVLPEVCCLKTPGPLGEELSREVPLHSGLLSSKFDLGVLFRLRNLMRSRRIDALVTVGAGDKMFWGRLAAWSVGLPVICSALHSTGWPDGVGRMNRWLTPITDAFIGCAAEHGRHLVERERFPARKVHVIPNGVDTDRFCPQMEARAALRGEFHVAENTPLCGIVAALRPEKNHELFLQSAALVRRRLPAAEFVIVGDGPKRGELETLARSLGIESAVHFLGTRSDIPAVLAGLDLFALTSHNEANPVSILEAMATGLPVVSTRVGSVAESVADGATGQLVPPGDAAAMSAAMLRFLSDRRLSLSYGAAGREHVVRNWSLDQMVRGYENLLCDIYAEKATRPATARPLSRGMQPLSR